MAQRRIVAIASRLRPDMACSVASSSRASASTTLLRSGIFLPKFDGTDSTSIGRLAGSPRRSLTTTAARASGHNKWSKIRHKKGANDVARGKTYSSISREIVNAIRSHPTQSASPESNARLAALIRRAKEVDFPKDKLDAAIKRAEASAGGGSGDTSISFEALGPTAQDGTPVALVIECLTDSPARTRSKIKEICNKHHLRLSSTAHLFEKKGVIRLYANKNSTFEDVFLAAVEVGAEDVLEWDAAAEEGEDGSSSSQVAVEIRCDPSEMHAISAQLAAEPHNHMIEMVEAQMLPLADPLRVELSENGEEEGNAVDSSSSFIMDTDVERLDKIHELLSMEADADRVWSNVAGWPER